MDKNEVKVKNVKDSYTLILTKMNGQKMGYIHYDKVTKLSRGIKRISELEFTINKYYGVDNDYNPLYDELQNERFIELDNEEIFVIKDVKKNKNNQKTVIAYGKEKKLCNISIEIEDITLTLINPYTDIEGCYSLDELLYEYTGWRLGYVSDEVRYRKNETILDILNDNVVTLTEEENLRYQESISSNWYDFINNDIAEQFECYPVFDSYNKVVHLYSDAELGERLQLLLSYDNYLKDHAVTTNSEEIITRIQPKGNEDLTILEENPTGETYIEDYSYFIEREEMTQGLINALNLYNTMVIQRTQEWYVLRGEKETKQNELQAKKVELTFLYRKMMALNSIIDSTTNEEYKAEVIVQLTELNDKKVVLENEVDGLTTEIRYLEEAITNVILLCKKKTATDNNGLLIFNDALLDELKEFIFQDSYASDSITDALTLYKIGQRELKKRIRPTITWEVDTVNFAKRIIDNGFRQQWSGELALGDMILLQDDDGITTPVYFIGYTQSFKKGQETLELELSNMKENNDFSLSIGERLTLANRAYKITKSNQGIINKLKTNRVGLTYDKINKEIL